MSILVYGATGYTGTLIAEEAVRRGMAVTLAGRNESALQQLGERLRLPHVTAALDDQAALDRAVGDGAVQCVLHCAGPFSKTARAMVQACLRARKHYLDITGEIAVFEELASLNDEALAAGVMVMPGVGFDVVPSDCLAAHVKRRLPSATKLRLCIYGGGASSHGTSVTVVEGFAGGGAVRKGGIIVVEAPAKRARTFDVGGGKTVAAVSMPWGDIATAWRSTHIPDIEVYFALPRRVRLAAKLAPLASPFLRIDSVKRFVQGLIPVGGPTAEDRAHARSTLVAEAEDAAGVVVTSRLVTPSGYDLTTDTALLVAQRVVAGDCKPGYQTPATAYGPDLILEARGTERMDT